jgi:hypothetical protein
LQCRECSLQKRFAAYLIFALLFPETLMQLAFQEKAAQFSQKSSKTGTLINPQNTEFL